MRSFNSFNVINNLEVIILPLVDEEEMLAEDSYRSLGEPYIIKKFLDKLWQKKKLGIISGFNE